MYHNKTNNSTSNTGMELSNMNTCIGYLFQFNSNAMFYSESIHSLLLKLINLNMHYNFELKYNIYMRDNLLNHLAHIFYFWIYDNYLIKNEAIYAFLFPTIMSIYIFYIFQAF